MSLSLETRIITSSVASHCRAVESTAWTAPPSRLAQQRSTSGHNFAERPPRVAQVDPDSRPERRRRPRAPKAARRRRDLNGRDGLGPLRPFHRPRPARPDTKAAPGTRVSGARAQTSLACARLERRDYICNAVFPRQPPGLSPRARPTSAGSSNRNQRPPREPV